MLASKDGHYLKFQWPINELGAFVESLDLTVVAGHVLDLTCRLQPAPPRAWSQHFIIKLLSRQLGLTLIDIR